MHHTRFLVSRHGGEYDLTGDPTVQFIIASSTTIGPWEAWEQDYHLRTKHNLIWLTWWTYVRDSWAAVVMKIAAPITSQLLSGI